MAAQVQEGKEFSEELIATVEACRLHWYDSCSSGNEYCLTDGKFYCLQLPDKKKTEIPCPFHSNLPNFRMLFTNGSSTYKE